MKKTLKILGFLFILTLIAVLAFVLTFDANNYKQNIISQVQQQSGRKLSIDGDIKLTIFPWIGLKVEKVTLGNAKGFSRLPLAKISQLEVKVQLLPLLSKELLVDKVRLHGLAASLEVSATGKNNWSNLYRSSAKSSKKQTEQKLITTTDNDGFALAGLAINGVELVDAAVNWSDAQTATKVKIVDLTLSTDAIEFDEPVAIKLSAGVVSNKPDIKAKISLQGDVQFNQSLNAFHVEDFQLSVITHLKELTPKPIILKLTTTTHLDLKQGTAHGDIQLSSAGAAIRSNFNITSLNTKPVINGTLSSNAMNARALAEKLQIKLPPMVSSESLTKISMRSSVQATLNSVHLDDLNVTLDGSLLSGWVHVSDMKQSKVRYSLNLKPITLDGYLPPPPPEPSNTSKVNAAILGKKMTSVDTTIPLPLDLLRTLDLDGVLNIDGISLKNIQLNKIKLPAKAAHGVLLMQPVTMNVFGGAIRAKIGLDVRAIPAYIVDLKASRLKASTVIDPILVGIMGDEKVTVQGIAKFNVKMKASGNSVLALKKSASGKIQIDMDRAILKGVDVEHYAHNAVADYVKAKNMPFLESFRSEYSPKQKTAFDRFHASFKASQGILINKDLILESKKAKVSGSGLIDIVEESIDYRPVLDISVKNPIRKIDKLKDMPMEFYIHGPFSKLKYELNTKKYYKSVENLFKKEARAKIKKKVETVKQKEKKKIEQKVKDKFKDKLKGLFKR
jgi:AsmA protein